jgi:peptide/nickel transport system permease protein
MMSAVVRRLAWSIVTIWAVVSLTFLVFDLLPSDPAQVIAGPQARPADVARIRVQLGHDRPIGVRYLRYMGSFLRVRGFGAEAPDSSSTSWIGPIGIDLGRSYLKQRPVIELLGDALPATALLTTLALAIEMILGTLAGVVAAVARSSALDWGVVALALFGVSAPTFVTGLALQYVLAEWLHLVPLDGYGTSLAQKLHAAVLPALTLGLFGAAGSARLIRDEMIELLRADYVRTARAKGQRPLAIVLQHALRNALLPLVTLLGLSMGSLVGGAIVTEKLFRWPGLGSLAVDAIVERDGPVMMGVVIVLSSAVVLVNLLVDLSYVLLDPRARRP